MKSEIDRSKDVFKNKTVLVVAENVLLRQILGEIFHAAGCTVWEVANEDEAVAHLQQNDAIDLLLVNLDYSPVEKVEKNWRNESALQRNKTLILIDHINEDTRHRLDKIETIRLVRKPFSMYYLLDKAKDHLLNIPDGENNNPTLAG